jgi:hypothetical protein
MLCRVGEKMKKRGAECFDAFPVDREFERVQATSPFT